MQKNIQKGTKGITLIALVITIIVLLILAGVTISQLTGSDSAPAKANEAAQKNAIGEAKDDVQLTAINAQTKGYEGAYLGTEIQAGSSKEYVGKTVVQELYRKYGASKQIGKATVSVTPTGSADVSNLAAITGGNITIFTTDFELTGEVELSGGVITWRAIEPNVPGVFLNTDSATLNPGGSADLTVRLKNASEPITWSGATTNITLSSTTGKTVTVRATAEAANNAENKETATITATSSDGYSDTCTITVEKVPVQKVSFNNVQTEIQKGEKVTLTITATDNSNKPATPTSVTYASTDTTVATIGETSGEIEGKKAGTTTISVTASDGTNSANASFTLTVIGSVIGQYVDYAVSYTDRYSEIEYGKETAGVRAVDAWRILDPGTKNADGSYSGTKIISTGIPAKLAYRSGTSNDWWGETGNANEKATYGMKYNFTSIPFITPQKSTVVYGEAYYDAITNSDSVGATNTGNGSIFITSKAKTTDDTNTTDIESVHALTLEEMNTAINKLNGLKSGDTGYRSEASTSSVASYDLFHMKLLSNYTQDYYYWLASPNSDNINLLRGVNRYGDLNNNGLSTNGVRPVVSLNSNIYKENGIWKIR